MKSRNQVMTSQAQVRMAGLAVSEKGSFDLIFGDPPYPGVKRSYGCMTETAWHEMMRYVLTDARQLLKPKGSICLVVQPGYKKLGQMRLWPYEFVMYAARDYGFNLVQDWYWHNPSALPLAGANRKYGLLKASVKWLVWLALDRDCYRCQEEILLPPSDSYGDDRRAREGVKRKVASGNIINHPKIAETVKKRGGTVPLNLVRFACTQNPTRHPAPTPLKVADMVVRYLCPPGGKVLDPWAGSGTIGVACRDAKARDGSQAPRQYLGIEKHQQWVEEARERLAGLTGCDKEPRQKRNS